MKVFPYGVVEAWSEKREALQVNGQCLKPYLINEPIEIGTLHSLLKHFSTYVGIQSQASDKNRCHREVTQVFITFLVIILFYFLFYFVLFCCKYMF